ncbi:MAG: hypothetical protein RIC95_08400 [Vicingaceae bacterium]
MDKGAIFEVEITKNAQKRLHTIFERYLIKHFSEVRAYEVFDGILETVKQLKTFPKRGQFEGISDKDVRYIIHSESRMFQLKILYIVNEDNREVVVLDFFPTNMNPDLLQKLKI